MKLSRPWFKFGARDWLLATRRMNAEQRGYRIQLYAESSELDPPGSVPADQAWLLAGAPSQQRWKKNSSVVLEGFEFREGRYWIPDVVESVAEYDRIVEKKRAAGKLGADAKWHGKRMADAMADAKQMQWHNDGQTETDTDTDKEKTKPSVPKSAKAADRRHAEFIDILKKARDYASPDVPFSWGAADSKVLKSVLRDNPHLDGETFKRCVWNRLNSEGVVKTQQPRFWLSHILDYAEGSLNTYNKRPEIPNGQAGNKAIARLSQNIAAIVSAREPVSTGEDLYEPAQLLPAGSGPLQAKLWLKAMGHYSIELVETAIERHMIDAKEGKFFPLPANLVQHITTIHQERAERTSAAQYTREMRELREREKQGEEFFTLGDVLREFQRSQAEAGR